MAFKASHYRSVLRRRREGKTDYDRRRAAIASRQPLLAARITGENTIVQIVEPRLGGDRILCSAHSRELLRYGWKGSRRNTPAAYLTGFLAGLKARKEGVKKCVPYVGVKTFVRGSRISASLKGVLDAGVEVPADNEALPKADRLRAEHIAAYAATLASKDKAALKQRFGRAIAAGLDPSSYPRHVEDVKASITSSLMVKKA